MEPKSIKVNAIKDDGSRYSEFHRTMNSALQEVLHLKAQGYVVVSIATYY